MKKANLLFHMLRPINQLAIALCLGALCLIVLCLHIDFSNSGNSIRKRASSDFHKIPPEEFPAQIPNLGNGRQIWSIRSPSSTLVLEPGIASAAQFLMESPAIVHNALAGKSEAQTVAASHYLFHDDPHALAILGFMPPERHDALDMAGHPVRWQLAQSFPGRFSAWRVKNAKEAETKIDQLSRTLAKYPAIGNMAEYRRLIENFSRRYKLSTALVMAIIHSESDFRPNLVSSKSAMGLMQLLPSTASGEVHKFLYGRSGQINFEQLSVPETNIRYGTAYLHILYNRYFADVSDAQVREACVIASYNLGPNRFLRLYGSTNEAAVAKINAMSNEEFHRDLPRRLPVRETRYYVEKVRRMKEHYQSMYR